MVAPMLVGLAVLVICPVCPVTDGTEPKMRPGPARPRPAEPEPGRILDLSAGFLWAWPGRVLGQTVEHYR